MMAKLTFFVIRLNVSIMKRFVHPQGETPRDKLRMFPVALSALNRAALSIRTGFILMAGDTLGVVGIHDHLPACVF